MHKFTRIDIDKMSKIFRLNLINSITGYKSANLIGTKTDDKINNVAVFSSVTHLGSDPPLIGFITRPENGNRNVLVHVFTALISGISFSDYGKARLIVVLALREQEAHLLTLHNESPFTLAWCFEFINNYDNHIALEYMMRFFRRNVL